MKKSFLILILTIVVGVASAQTGLYFGYENGVKWDQFHYLNSKDFNFVQYQLDGVWGGYVGYKMNSFSVETGLCGFYTSAPWIDYDYATGTISKTLSSHGSSGMDSWVIPTRFGKEFLFSKNKLFFKPELAFNTIIARDYPQNKITGNWSENFSFDGEPDSSLAKCYRSSKITFGIETSVSTGYRFKEKADIYIKGSYYSSFTPIYYEAITHYSGDEKVNATNTFNGKSFLLQIGLRYYFSKRNLEAV